MATKTINLGKKHGVEMWMEKGGVFLDSLHYQGDHFHAEVVCMVGQYRIFVHRRDTMRVGLPKWMNAAEKAVYPTYDDAKKMAFKIAGWSMNAAERAEADAEGRMIDEEMAHESRAHAE